MRISACEWMIVDGVMALTSLMARVFPYFIPQFTKVLSTFTPEVFALPANLSGPLQSRATSHLFKALMNSLPSFAFSANACTLQDCAALMLRSPPLPRSESPFRREYRGPSLPSVIQERCRRVSGQGISQWRRGRTCDVMHRSIKDCRGTRRCCKWHWRPPTPAPVLAIQSEDA